MQKIDSVHERSCRMIIRHVKNPLKWPFGLAAKILKFNFTSSELRCLPLRKKLGIKVTCGNWHRLLYGAALKSATSSWGISWVCKGKKYQHLQWHVFRRRRVNVAVKRTQDDYTNHSLFERKSVPQELSPGSPLKHHEKSCFPMRCGRHRTSFDRISEYDTGRIVAYNGCELSFREIGHWAGRNQGTVMWITGCHRNGQTNRTDRTHLVRPLPMMSN
ncbi:hypothetical protein TNCV_3469741 [Trichonephila clavipes]|nr:hypothetical protein TNCV_3469741 [Trichonephila clavipes]